MCFDAGVKMSTMMIEVTSEQLKSNLQCVFYILCMKLTCFGYRHFLLLRRRFFSFALGYGAGRRPAWTQRRKCGPSPKSAARALGVQKSWKREKKHGIDSHRLEPNRPMQTQKNKHRFPPHVIFSFSISTTRSFYFCVSGCLPLLRCNSRASSFSRCDSHERCFCVCVRQCEYICTRSEQRDTVVSKPLYPCVAHHGKFWNMYGRAHGEIDTGWFRLNAQNCVPD